MSLHQDANSYDPPGHLEYGRTYYWRVDEVNGPPDSTVHTGEVWSFTVEPFAREVRNIVATASSSERRAGPENTVNGSGLDATACTRRWTRPCGSAPRAVRSRPGFSTSSTGSISSTRCGSGTTTSSIESVLGRVQGPSRWSTPSNGTDWAALGDFEFAQGTSAEGYAHNTTVDFHGVAAKYVKLTANEQLGRSHEAVWLERSEVLLHPGPGHRAGAGFRRNRREPQCGPELASGKGSRFARGVLQCRQAGSGGWHSPGGYSEPEQL